MSEKSLQAKTETDVTGPIEATVVNLDYVMKQLKRLYNALVDATGNPAVAVDVLEKIAEGIEADPAFSQQILTPDNIAKAYALKAKADAGTIKLADLEEAFPVIVEKIPFWSLVKTFNF